MVVYDVAEEEVATVVEVEVVYMEKVLVQNAKENKKDPKEANPLLLVVCNVFILDEAMFGNVEVFMVLDSLNVDLVTKDHAVHLRNVLNVVKTSVGT